MNISKEISIEELVHYVPESVNYLRKKGIKCIACGEPVWGTLEDVAKEKGLTYSQIAEILDDLDELVS